MHVQPPHLPEEATESRNSPPTSNPETLSSSNYVLPPRTNQPTENTLDPGEHNFPPRDTGRKEAFTLGHALKKNISPEWQR